jgi:predicted ArsR family transcriptional regulator
MLRYQARSHGHDGSRVEGQILGLLAEGALAPEQIAANLRAEEQEVRDRLGDLRQRGFVERSVVTHYPPELATALAYWRITDAGRAHLEQRRAEEQ